LTYIPWQMFGWDTPYVLFGLVPYAVIHKLMIWQLATYLFLHAGFFHIIFNLFALWMFGPDLELEWGSSQFLFFYFLTGTGAGIVDVVLQPSSHTTTIGCSGAIYGLLLAYGLIFPNRPIYLYFFIPIKAKWFVLLMGVMEFVAEFSSPGSGVAHVAHLGGMLFAYVYLRGARMPFRLQGRYDDWRRARLRKRFESYMRKHEKRDDAGRWVN
ncbi:MAG: rhomboid family intramembrane serine protease, partial [Terriglobia bacterium]